MDDAGGVRFGQGLRRLDADLDDVAGRQSRFPDPLGQVLAIDVLHDDEDVAVFFADFIDGANIGMVQCGRGLGLVDQPLPGLMMTG